MNLSSTSLGTIKLEDQTNYILMEISKIKDYFNSEIQYQQSLTNKLSKYLTFLDYINKILAVVFQEQIFLLMLKEKNNYLV